MTSGRGRIVFGFVANIALAFFLFLGKNHFFDTRDYSYVSISLWWTFAMAVVPSAVLLGILPAVMSKNFILRWMGIGLSLFPGFLTLTQWFQLILVFAEHR